MKGKKEIKKNVYRYPNNKKNSNLEDDIYYEFGDDDYIYYQLELEKKQINQTTSKSKKNKKTA